MNEIVGMMLVKNESHRYLEQSLEQMKKICSKIIILDDNSVDNTMDICSRYTELIYLEKELSFTKNESSIRNKLLRLTLQECDNNDWIICLDADEIIDEKTIPNLYANINVANTNNINAIAFQLFDIWTNGEDLKYREDNLWNAHKRPWILCYRVTELLRSTCINDSKLHCGRFPNIATAIWDIECCVKIKHMGWAKKSDRLEKYSRYIKLDKDGKLGNLNQYRSILDEDPNLYSYNNPIKKVLICAPVREDSDIFELYLNALDNLIIPENVIVEKHFILHNSPNLIEICDSRKINYTIFNSENNFVKDEDRHNWDRKNVDDVIAMKNGLADFALRNNFDYVFMVDSDVIVQTKTLLSLIKEEKQIISEIFWTDWENNGLALPNCWYWDSYGFTIEAMELWKEKGVYPVGMTGACILIKTDVYKKFNYDRIYNISFDGEDRFFCIRAACNNVEIYIDTKYPATHLYRQSDKENYVKSLTMRGE
jgi:hypothetical protein